MKKLIKISAITSVGLHVLSLVLLIASIPLQYVYFSDVEFFRDAIPMFPILPFVFCFLYTCCTVILLIGCSKGRSYGLEIVIFLCIALILPIANMIVSPMYATILNRTSEAAQAAVYGTVMAMSNYCMIASNTGHALACAVCGMSIVFKAVNKSKGEENG